MKNKDLNTYINEKLDQGDGLPYKEEYWNDMNGLLDANMPVMKPTHVAAKVASNGFKWLYLSSVCAAVFSISYIYLHLFSPSSQTVSENISITAPESVTPKASVPFAYENVTKPIQQEVEKTSEQDHENAQKNVVTSETSAPEVELEKDIIQNQAGSQIVAQTKHLSAEEAPLYDRNDKAEKGISSAILLTKKNESASTLSTLIIADQSVSGHIVDFTYIDPLSMWRIATEITDLNHNKFSLISYPKRNRFIQHIAVSPFVGIMYESGKQTYRYQNTEYTHPVQSNIVYGVNVECATKQFAIRTGIGWSNTQLEKSVETTQDIYKADTNYTVVNPNYGTTLSGKPVALIKRTIDSSVVSTQHSALHQSTTYQYITIPLTLQYRITHKRIAVVFEGGALHHFMISQTTHSPVQQTNPENHFQLPGYSIQLTAGSGLRYAVSSKWALGLQYNYTLNPLSANMHLLNNAHVTTFMITRTIR